ncbi:hypothetical protein [Lacipirellula limnantheis]|uniref:Uncharacterized protein n=1 Tax=Lacipirellula limnantheis TaxID=2528024 RepID=A0A517TYL0_9BACT|nr:hypothetical protein [Lacipirellula limnantheis]QDT73457.1 hypothetical protein I41_26460 [Lacipirellula limnantheis]
MSDEPIPYVEGERPPSPRHIRAILKHQDGSPDEDVWIDPETLKHGQLRHSDIDELLPMIRWVWRHNGKRLTWCRTFEDWELGFMRDANPGSEVAAWLTATYAMLEFSHRCPSANVDALFAAVCCLMNGNDSGIQPASVATNLKELMANPPKAMSDPKSFTDDGKYKAGEKHLR